MATGTGRRCTGPAAKWAVLPMMLLLAAALGACNQGRQGDEQAGGAGGTVTWKMGSTFPGSLPVLGQGALTFIERIDSVSRGRLKIQFFDPGKLVPALELFDAVSEGAVDAGWSVSGYWVGKFPAAAFFTSVPFGPAATEFLTWVYEGGGLELWRELYARRNVVPIPCGMVPPDGSGWFREPITRLEQLKGKKIRYFGLGGETMQKLGASVQLLAGGDIYPALERGVIDALEFAQPVIDKELGFYRIVKHYYLPGWHQQDSLLELIVNGDRWKALDPADQALIEMACKESIVHMITLGESLQPDALVFFRAHGVTIHQWSPEMLDGFRKAYQEVLQDDAAKNADFQRVYDSYRAFREKYGQWARLSRVPAEHNAP